MTEKNAAKLHERDQRFRQTLNFFPDGVVLTRKDWEIEFLNPIATRDFGLDPAKDLGNDTARGIRGRRIQEIRREK